MYVYVYMYMYILVESVPHPIEELRGVVCGAEAVEHERALLRAEAADIDLGHGAGGAAEDGAAEAVVGGQPLQRRPPERGLLLLRRRLLVLPASAARAREDIATGRPPHDS